ncbi:hypothetical protein ACFFK0_18750 [Paenibacillus chartarius]|uniref:Uncharacterized protein n=1 Tax=Paenibacillus chartarius TaxID=747481 RepID=A0ABV6DP97_9BACL
MRVYKDVEHEQGKDMPQQLLLKELQTLAAELREKERATVYSVPEAMLEAVKKEKQLEKFLQDVFIQVSGSGGTDIRHIIRRQFGMSKEQSDTMHRWASHIKEQLEEALHDAIERADIRTGKLFFVGDVPRKQMAEALELLKGIAHAAVRRQLHPRSPGAEVYVEMLELTLRYCSLPYTYPAAEPVTFRNLIALDRLEAMAGGERDVIEALKRCGKAWYQRSGFTFLEQRDTYFSYEQVSQLLYTLTDEQLERLRSDYIRYVEHEYNALKAKPELHRAELLTATLEAALGWEAGRVYEEAIEADEAEGPVPLWLL